MLAREDSEAPRGKRTRKTERSTAEIHDTVTPYTGAGCAGWYRRRSLLCDPGRLGGKAVVGGGPSRRDSIDKTKKICTLTFPLCPCRRLKKPCAPAQKSEKGRWYGKERAQHLWPAALATPWLRGQVSAQQMRKEGEKCPKTSFPAINETLVSPSSACINQTLRCWYRSF